MEKQANREIDIAIYQDMAFTVMKFKNSQIFKDILKDLRSRLNLPEKELIYYEKERKERNIY